MKFDIRTRQFGRLFSNVGEEGAPLSIGERRQRRQALFAEPLWRRIWRLAGMAGAAFRTMGLRDIFGACDFLLRERAIAVAGLPDPAAACSHPEGLCGLVADQTPEGLMEGYARGLHAAAPFGLLAWWSPALRTVMTPAESAMPENARALIQNDKFKVVLDRDFDAVVKACGARQRLSPRIMHLYAGLHDMGFAHSVEVRSAFGRLVAGAYGVALGRVFITLGVFGETPDQQALALTTLNGQLARLNFALHEVIGLTTTPHMGFTPMKRDVYFETLIANSGYGRLGRWQLAPASSAMQLRAA